MGAVWKLDAPHYGLLMRYILWVVALLGACDVTNNGRHLGRLVGFYQGIEIKSNAR